MSGHKRVVVQAPAKVNLSLDITGTTADGYHTLETVMQAVDLCDIVIIGKRDGKDIRVSCSKPGVPEDAANIAHKAAIAFFARSGLPVQGLWIHIDKVIPVQAGLAGGSADAAAVLCGMNSLFDARLSDEFLREIGETVGADVPFCVTGGCKLARGKGEKLTELKGLRDGVFIIAKPAVGVDTRQAFKLYDEMKTPVSRPDTASMLRAIEDGNLPETGRLMSNVFESIIPLGEVDALKNILLREGALGAVMSGSGSAVAGLFDQEKTAQNCYRVLLDAGEEVYIAKPVSHGAKIIHES